MESNTKTSISDILRETGIGTRAVSLTAGTVTYAGRRKEPEGDVLLFTFREGVISVDTDGFRNGVPDLVPSPDGGFFEWEAMKNLLAFQRRILSTEISSPEDFKVFRTSYASVSLWWRKTSANSPDSVTGRLARAFLARYDRKVAQAAEVWLPEKKTARRRRPVNRKDSRGEAAVR